MTPLHRIARLGLATLCIATLSQCSKQTQEASDSSQAPAHKSKSPLSIPPPPLAKPNSLIVALWQSQQLHLDKAIHAADALRADIENLLATPTAVSLSTSQQQWLDAANAIEALALIGPLAKTARGSAWQSVNHAFGHIARWPAQLGYLDDNGVHGKTGLIYDLDTPINASTLRQQHGLTHSQDATLGLYPLGLLLWGANGSRTADDFELATALNDSHRVMGYSHPDELASNRRRQLIQLQAELLVADLTELRSTWARRDRNSALNALSQPALDEQRTICINAGLTLTTQQLLELKSSPEQRAEHTPAYGLLVTLRRNQRWHSQLNALQQWLTLLELGEVVPAIDELQEALAAINSKLGGEQTEAKPADGDAAAANTPLEGAPESHSNVRHELPLNDTDEQLIEAKLSSLALLLKQSLATSSKQP
ncbi:MAG TPA: imelysin family protein [Marinagarivorans sp.]